MAGKTHRCPICNRPVTRDAPTFPFCGKRCQTIDLGRWAGGDYRIAGDNAMPWEMEHDAE